MREKEEGKEWEKSAPAQRGGRYDIHARRGLLCATGHEISSLDAAEIVSENTGSEGRKDEPEVANQHRRKGGARAGSDSDEEDDLECFDVGVDDTGLELDSDLADLLRRTSISVVGRTNEARSARRPNCERA